MPATTTATPRRAARRSTEPDELTEIAVEAYLYAYPLVLMDVSRRLMTNVERPLAQGAALGAPLNQFAHMPAFPDPSFTAVVRPNADTLYSSMFLDVRREPLVVDVPDSGGRYYLLPLLDMWTDVFASPGPRTTGTGAHVFAIVGPGWAGSLPEGVERIDAPTPIAWMIGRTETNGTADYDAVHTFQAGLLATPLSAWRAAYAPPPGQVDPSLSTDPPDRQVARMDPATFFTRFAELLRVHPPHANDQPLLARMARLGLVPGAPLDLASLRSEVKRALATAPVIAKARLDAYLPHAAPVVNGWQMMASPIGTYGTDYVKRALIAATGLGANCVEDATYPFAFTDGEGRPLDALERYKLHFEPAQIPPVNAFWSLTMYDDRQLFADNPIDRYALGDRDPLTFNDDGSLDLYVQRESPGEARARNWLPTPASGRFSMNLRLYWPKTEVLDGTWAPPPVERVA